MARERIAVAQRIGDADQAGMEEIGVASRASCATRPFRNCRKKRP